MNKLNVVLLLLVMASAMSVVTVQHRAAEWFAAGERAQARRVELNREYGRLQAEQVRLANHEYIKSAAARLRLQAPTLNRTQAIILSE